jgi:hypothetical protein
MFFRFPPDARWNPERSVVEFGIGIGEYEGVVRVSRRVFQILLSGTPTPEHCLESYHFPCTRHDAGERVYTIQEEEGRPEEEHLQHRFRAETEIYFNPAEG